MKGKRLGERGGTDQQKAKVVNLAAKASHPRQVREENLEKAKNQKKREMRRL